MKFRVLSGIILLFSVFMLPFWFSALLAISLMIYHSFYIEAVILVILNDLFYGVKEVRFFNEFFFVSISVVLIFFIIEFFKQKLEFHSV
ncbi:MAG: hypothetical protein AAB438_02400 [Patescibacteria group bacterium]